MAGKLEQLSVDKNGNIKRGKTKPKKSKNSKKNNILAKNKAKGRAFENKNLHNLNLLIAKLKNRLRLKQHLAEKSDSMR